VKCDNWNSCFPGAALPFFYQANEDNFIRLSEKFNNAPISPNPKGMFLIQLKQSFEMDQPNYVIDEKSQHLLIQALYAMPHGVTEMSRDIPNFVQTSTNLASVKTYDDHFFITTSQRSSVASALDDVVNMVAAVFKLAGAEVEHTDGYPGWSPNPKSNILQVAKKSYEKLFNEAPKVLAVHAGLECGLIGETYPKMDMISYGPELKGVHSPDEKIHIKSVEKFWIWTLDILKDIPEREKK
jgi:dipeptidase D